MGRGKKLQGDSRIVEPTVKQSYTTLFYQALPDYLEIGMTYDQYWYDEPIIALYYWRANRLSIKRKNQEMYMQGLYNFQAFSRALANLNFSGKHQKTVNYLDEPYDVLGETKEEHELEVEKAKAKVKAQLSAWKSSFNKSKGGEKCQ